MPTFFGGWSVTVTPACSFVVGAAVIRSLKTNGSIRSAAVTVKLPLSFVIRVAARGTPSSRTVVVCRKPGGAALAFETIGRTGLPRSSAAAMTVGWASMRYTGNRGSQWTSRVRSVNAAPVARSMRASTCRAATRNGPLTLDGSALSRFTRAIVFPRPRSAIRIPVCSAIRSSACQNVAFSTLPENGTLSAFFGASISIPVCLPRSARAAARVEPVWSRETVFARRGEVADGAAGAPDAARIAAGIMRRSNLLMDRRREPRLWTG